MNQLTHQGFLGQLSTKRSIQFDQTLLTRESGMPDTKK